MKLTFWNLDTLNIEHMGPGLFKAKLKSNFEVSFVIQWNLIASFKNQKKQSGDWYIDKSTQCGYIITTETLFVNN